VCHGCRERLAQRLRLAADLWEHVRDTVAHQTRVEGSAVFTTRPSGPVGPTCQNEACDHESCTAIWKHRTRNAGYVEPPPHEDRGLIDWASSERAWIVVNTTSAWVRRVDAQRGNAPRPRILKGRELHVIADDVRPDLCIFSNLPNDMCACGHNGHHEEAS
jgi:hypothetical protein